MTQPVHPSVGAKELPPRPFGRVWTMRHGQYKATLDLRLVEGLGAEIVLSIDNELRLPTSRKHLRVGILGR